MWFYEHTTRFAVHDKELYPSIASWAKVDHGGRYDAFKLLGDIKESEVRVIFGKSANNEYINRC